MCVPGRYRLAGTLSTRGTALARGEGPHRAARAMIVAMISSLASA
jgi:hypothetical protein